MTQAEDEARRTDNFDLVTRLYAAHAAKDADSFSACIADDIVFEAPAYRPDGKPVATGRDEMSRIFQVLCERFTTMEYAIKRFIPAVDPDLVLAEVKGNNLVATNDTYYRNNYLFLITCQDGRIKHIFEYSNPEVYAATAGAN
ncbi:MAG TPA: nuclear transport factor 2 family protein [Jatrophihabitans sp.]